MKPKYTGPERRKSGRWRPRPVRVLLALVVLLAVLYGGAILWLVSQETRLVFEARSTLSPSRPAFPYEQVDLPRTDGRRQFAWLMPVDGAAEAPWVIFLHGNAATIASRVNISHYQQLRALGLSVLAPEYRGFGGLDGEPTEKSLSVDARAGYDYLRTARRVSSGRIVIYGWSLGGGVAVNLAAETEQAAVILEGAPASLVAIGQQRYPLFPIRLLMRNPFDVVDRVGRIQSPMLFLHSPDDVVIPLAEGRRLYEAARAVKTFVEVRGGHVDASEADGERFKESIERFLRPLFP